MMPQAKTSPSSRAVIRHWVDVADRERLTGALDAIFFEASGTKSFASEEVRAGVSRALAG
ncbi:MAG: hypothetical protein WDN31_09370 [Hyphomicrobium sp.]